MQELWEENLEVRLLNPSSYLLDSKDIICQAKKSREQCVFQKCGGIVCWAWGQLGAAVLGPRAQSQRVGVGKGSAGPPGSHPNVRGECWAPRPNPGRRQSCWATMIQSQNRAGREVLLVPNNGIWSMGLHLAHGAKRLSITNLGHFYLHFS